MGRSGVIGFIKIGEAYSAACKCIKSAYYTARAKLSNFPDKNILDPIWDIAQMATSMICCCAPSFPRLFSDVHLPKSLRSILATLNFVKSKRSVRGGPTAGPDMKQKWVRNSRRDLAWTEVSAMPYSKNLPSEGIRYEAGHQGPLHQEASGSECPLKVVEIRQDIEYV